MNHDESLKIHQSFDDEFDGKGIPFWLSVAIASYEAGQQFKDRTTPLSIQELQNPFDTAGQKYTKEELLRIGHAILNHVDVQNVNVVMLKEDGTPATEAERIDVYFAVVTKAIESNTNEKNEAVPPTNANTQKLTTEVADDGPLGLHKKLDMEIAMTGTIPLWLAETMSSILMEDINPETATFEELVAASNEFSLQEITLIGHAILDRVVEDPNDPGVVKFRDTNGEIVAIGTADVDNSMAIRRVALEVSRNVREDRRLIP